MHDVIISLSPRIISHLRGELSAHRAEARVPRLGVGLSELRRRRPVRPPRTARRPARASYTRYGAVYCYSVYSCVHTAVRDAQRERAVAPLPLGLIKHACKLGEVIASIGEAVASRPA